MKTTHSLYTLNSERLLALGTHSLAIARFLVRTFLRTIQLAQAPQQKHSCTQLKAAVRFRPGGLKSRTQTNVKTLCTRSELTSISLWLQALSSEFNSWSIWLMKPVRT